MIDQIKIGGFLRELRKEKELTQEQLAEKFGVSARSIWRDIDLLSGPPDGNMPPTKGGISSGTHHSTGSAHEAG